MTNPISRARITWVRLVQWPFLVPATAAMFLVVFIGAAWLLLRTLQNSGYNRTPILLIVALVMIMFFFGLIIASYQQRLSKRLKLVIGEQDQILASVLTNSVDAVIVFDNEDNIQMWNRGAQLIFGYTPEEILGQSIAKLIPPDIDPSIELGTMNRMVEEQGYVRNYISRRITKDGRRITVDISRTLFRSGDGQFVGYTAVVKDVTDKLELDQKMYSAEKLASIGLLASGVAHEINNPLTIILGFTELLKDRFDPESPEWQDLDKIENNATQAQKIVEDLLGFSRAKQVADEKADLREGALTLTDFVKQTRIAKKVELELDIPEDLPLVNGDPREIQQILLNLINNAVAAMDGKAGMVRIHAHQVDEDWVELTVEDTGKGIPEEIRPSVFDPFFTTKEFGEGTGLGLSLCYGLAKKWGGSIEFHSRTTDDDPDGLSGTVFTIRIPVYDAEFNPETTS
jgi:two-component system, NtrC family, sensor kinase